MRALSAVLALNALLALSGPAIAGDSSQLLSELQSPESSVRWRAADALGRVDPPSSDIVTALRQQLGGDDPSTKANSAYALVRIAKRRPALVMPAVPDLIAGLSDRSADVRSASAFALAVVTPHTEAALRGLLGAMKYPDNQTSFEVERALSRIGYPKSMHRIPAPPSAQGYERIAYQLPVMAFGVVSRLEFWLAITGFLVFIGFFKRRLLTAAPAVYLLAGILPWALHPILLSLTGRGMDSAGVMLTQTGRLLSESPFWLPLVLQALLLGALRANSFLSTLAGTVYVIGAAAALMLFGLYGMAIGSQRAIFIFPLAINLMLLAPLAWLAAFAGWSVARSIRTPKIAAALVLGLLLPGAAIAGESEVLATLKSPSFGDGTARAYARNGHVIVPGLIEALDSGDKHQVQGACSTLSYMGPVGRDAIPALARTLRSVNNENWIVGHYAARALSSMGSEATQTLIDLAHDPKEAVRGRAIEALADDDQPADIAVAELIRLLSDTNPRTRAAALDAIGLISIGRRSAALVAVPSLLRALEDPALRAGAAQALGELKPENPEVAAALIKIVGDPSDPAASRAAQALSRIGTVDALAAEKRYRLSKFLKFENILGEMLYGWAYGAPYFAFLFGLLLAIECLVYGIRKRRFMGIALLLKFILLNAALLIALSLLMMLKSRARFL